MTGQADADPVQVAYEWLRDHPRTIVLLGGRDHVSGLAEPPWPHVFCDDGTNGDLREGWSAEYEVTIEVVGGPDGTPGKAALRSLAYGVLDMLRELPEADVTTLSQPVVSRVRPSGVFSWAPMANGQGRYVIGVLITLRPGLS